LQQESFARAATTMGRTLNLNQEGCLMERREFLKLTVGFAAAAGAIAATAAAAQAATTPLPASDALTATEKAETSARVEADKVEHEATTREGDRAELEKDTEFSAQRWWRRRRRVFYRRRRRFWRRRRRVIYY
jgi:hypothetical protein